MLEAQSSRIENYPELAAGIDAIFPRPVARKTGSSSVSNAGEPPPPA